MAQNIIDGFVELMGFQAQQAYGALEFFNTKRDELPNVSLATFTLHASYARHVYQGLADYIARLEGHKPVERGCYYITTNRNETKSDSELQRFVQGCKIQAVIGLYGMNLLDNILSEKAKKIQGPICDSKDFLATLVVLPNDGPKLDVHEIEFVGRSYLDIISFTDNVVMAKRFDLMLKALDDVRTSYPQKVW